MSQGLGKWGNGEVGEWGSGGMGKWGSGEIELKPQNLKPISRLPTPDSYLLTPQNENFVSHH
ncbi:MAG: hypothetical protein EWV76_02735 [Microcystis novacekii Mn_MB_F_20050700_S1]|uniref:Uncharacterized protein n=1 Tax=Microcystis novacekii Mn_MB_F_20050700_S1D TaxID=2486266 RepID=A0A552IPU9_9CHRO|nr:MAG: hypothetical protein EWV54_16020 [Microcystis novacekii Mn_MB_F_20050700_S1D]TRU92175.1 MAG: hypothetical protein EWV76_02735 [Microcystis novacekii Mn_MB_F_20050700_S1]